MYYGGKKIGYTQVISTKTAFRGSQALCDRSASVTSLTVFGQTVRQTIDLVSYSDLTHRPIYQEFGISSNGSATTIWAEYRARTIECTTDTGSGTTRKTIAIPAGARLVGDTDTARVFDRNDVGRRAVVYSLNPLTLTLDRSQVAVVSKERIAVGGQEREAYRVVTDTPMGQVITWETGDGMPIRAVAPMGITLYAESEAIARDLTSAEPAFSERGHGTVAASRAAYVPPSDFAVGTSVEADRRIVDAANLRVLVIELQGLRKEQAITDSRQRVTPIPGKPGTYRVEVEAGTLSAEQAAALPLRPPRSVAAMTGPATYLETDDSRIRELAEQIRSRETNAYRVACRIRAWVHRNMRPDYTIGTPRSCVDILKNKRGVCRDYATLFVSIARAAGIPARIAGGIVYTRGRFYYHAWGECWVGQWVAFDATRATDFVDATHIKLAEGGVPEMYQVVNAVGRLKARIIQSGSGGTAVRSGDLGLRGRRPVGTVPTSFARAGVRSRHITTRPARTVREVVLP